MRQPKLALCYYLLTKKKRGGVEEEEMIKVQTKLQHRSLYYVRIVSKCFPKLQNHPHTREQRWLMTKMFSSIMNMDMWFMWEINPYARD